MDNNNSDKDAIKEMLEGHKKKFNVVAIVVGIAAVIIIVLAAAYVIHTLNRTPKSYTEENFNKYVGNSNIQNTKNKPPQQAVPVGFGNNTQNAKNEQNVQPKVYSIPSTVNSENNTTASINSQKSQTSVNSKSTATSPGPQIINPYAPKRAKKNITPRTPTTKVKHKLRLKMAQKRIIKHYRHRYISPKKYVLQVSSNLNKRYVSATLKKLKKCGYKAYIRIKIIDDKVYRRVMVGPIKGYTAAKDEALLIKRQLKLEYTPIIKRYDKIP